MRIIYYLVFVGFTEKIALRGYIGTRLYGCFTDKRLSIIIVGVMVSIIHIPFHMIISQTSLAFIQYIHIHGGVLPIMEEVMEEKDIREICTANQLQCNSITKAIGSFGKELFFIDDKYLIRISKQSMLDEQFKINRVKDLKHVPKIIHASDKKSTDCEVYYLILEYIQGLETYIQNLLKMR